MSVVPTSYIVSCHAWLKTCDIYAQTNACTITSKCCKQLISNIFQNMICKYGRKIYRYTRWCVYIFLFVQLYLSSIEWIYILCIHISKIVKMVLWLHTTGYSSYNPTCDKPTVFRDCPIVYVKLNKRRRNELRMNTGRKIR